MITEAGGHRRPIELCTTKLSIVSLGYPGWSPGRACICHSNRLSWEPACRILVYTALLTQSGIWLNFLNFESNPRFLVDGLVRIELQISAWEWAYATVLFSHYSSPVRLTVIVVSRLAHSAAEFAMTSFGKCVHVCVCALNDLHMIMYTILYDTKLYIYSFRN